MSFIETPRFPDVIAVNAVAGPEYDTEVVPLFSGREARNIGRGQGRLRFDIEMPLLGEDKDTLLAFFRAMKGRGHGFRLKDWSDFRVTQDDGRLSEIVSGVTAETASDAGTGMPSYQLAKVYETGALAEHRWIRKPVVGTAAIYRGGSLASAGSSSGNYALDTTTGVVTWVASAASAVNAVSVGASTQVTLNAAIGLSIGGRLYLSGLTGTVASALNGLAHPITNVAGAVYTISTSTAGLAYTSGGTGYRYPQPDEALEWSGEFDVAVRFDADWMALTLRQRTSYRGPMSLRELLAGDDV